MIGLRLSKELLSKVKAQAKAEHRLVGPMAAEIVRRYYEEKEHASNKATEESEGQRASA